jgi:hypothetical protein
MSQAQINALIEECRTQAESCLYTSTGFFMWLQTLKRTNRLWNSIPIICGSLASFALLQQSYPIMASVLALASGLLPSVYEKLDLAAHTEELTSQAGQYKNLENRFKQAATILSLEGYETLKTEFAALMRQIEDLRARPIILPEKYFQAARNKIKSGHYEPDPRTVSS